jgi:hypothetical protein
MIGVFLAPSMHCLFDADIKPDRTEAAMARLIAPVLLALLPWTINAEPIYVDYEGEVRSLHAEEGGPSVSDFRVGQQIKGRLTVHTEPAIPDLGGGPGVRTVLRPEDRLRRQ